MYKEIKNYFDSLNKIKNDIENKKIDITDKGKAIELLCEINLIERNLIDIKEQINDLATIIYNLYDKIFSNFDRKELFENML